MCHCLLAIWANKVGNIFMYIHTHAYTHIYIQLNSVAIQTHTTISTSMCIYVYVSISQALWPHTQLIISCGPPHLTVLLLQTPGNPFTPHLLPLTTPFPRTPTFPCLEGKERQGKTGREERVDLYCCFVLFFTSV